MDETAQQPPSCREVCDWLLDYLTPVPGDDWLTPEQRQAVDAHVKGCPACRKEMADMDRVISGIRELGKIKIPQDSIDRMVDFAKKLEAQSRTSAEATFEMQPAKNSQLMHLRLAGWAAIGAAAAVFLIMFMPQIRMGGMREKPSSHGIILEQPQEIVNMPNDSSVEITGSESVAATETLDATVTSLPFAAEDQLAGITSPALALQWIRDAMGEGQKETPVWSLDEWRQWLTLLSQINERWPDSAESFTSLMIQSKCWEALGEAAKSREVFIQYADSESARIKERVLSVGSTPEEATQLFQQALAKRMKPELLRMFSEGNVLGATAYADVLLTRYGDEDGEIRHLTRYVYGRAYHGARQFSEVIRTYEDLATSDSAETWRRELLPYYRTALLNTRQGDKAAVLWQEELAYTEDRESQAVCLLNKAAALTPPLGRDLGSALRTYRQVQTEYPETAGAMYAANHIAMLREKTLGSLFSN